MPEVFLHREQYWASLDKEEIGSELQKKVEDWYRHIATSGIFRRMRKSYLAYYGFNTAGQGHTASEVTYAGDQGELSLIKVNQLRNIIQHMLVMTTSTRPAMDARAVNTDYKSLSQTILANSILDYYMRERKLERYLRAAVEHALVYGEGFIRLSWDTSIGDEYTVDNEGRIVYTGDIRFSVHNPLDIIRDVFQPDNNEHDWMMVRSFKNRYELMAKYPEYKDEILGVGTKDGIDLEYKFINFNLTTSSDLIPVYEFYHRRSESMPNGRLIAFISGNAVLYDGELPYREIPLYRIAPADQMQTTFGYTTAFDLLALQDITDALHSTIVTNQSTFGVQNIVAPQGHNLSVSQLGGGLNFIEYDPAAGKPEPLNLTFTPPEIFNYLSSVERAMETLSGVNSVARGNPEANLRSGNSLALVQSMAIQFNNGLQQSYAQLVEDVGTAIVKTLKDFASVERTAVLVGKNNRTYLKSFKGLDLKDVDRVVVDLGNPLAKTTAGKLEMANNLMQMGLIKSPDQYMTVMKTGNLDVMLEGPLRELTYIKQENEWLADGKEAPVLITDNHLQHIIEHKSVLSTIEARMNPDVMRAVRIHIEEHVNAMKNADPDVLAMIGVQPLQPGRTQMDNLDPNEAVMRRESEIQQQIAQQSMQGGMPMPGIPMQGGMPMEGAMPMQQEPIPGMPGQEMPGQPSTPTNPLTGQKWNPNTGGF
jgi:hypothetical protein